MSMLKFMPEGWTEESFGITKDFLKEAITHDKTLQGKVEKCDNNCNLHINLGNGLNGIIHRDEIEAININEMGVPKENLCTGKVNKFVQFKVKSFDEENNNVILSRKDVQEEALNWVKNDLQEGQEVCGIVKNIKPYGVFVEIGGGVVGLAHIEDLSVARIKTPFERVQIGQKLDIMIKSIDRENGKVMLSYKELLGTWEENVKNFKAGTKVKGIIRETEKNKNGIFVELTPNLVGMAEYRDDVKYGDKVYVYIKKIIPEKKKIKLVIV